jgi:hypothetical protein
MRTRFQAFALAGVLALTALTGGAAAVGLSHWGSHSPQAGAAPVQYVQQAQPTTSGWVDDEGGDR